MASTKQNTDVQESTGAVETPKSTGTVGKQAAPTEEMVKIKLFKDNDKYKNDVFVSRNGVSYQIQRGVEVEVPKGIAEILANSERMDQKTAEKIAAAQQKANMIIE